MRVAFLPLPRLNLYYGWWIVASTATILFIASGAFFYGFGALFNSLLAEFGWKRSVISLGFSLRAEVGGIAAPLVGFLVDRVGARRLMVVGVTLVGLGFLALSRINSLWSFFGAVTLIALGMSAAGGTVATVTVAHWFERKRGRALSLLYTGSGCAGAMVLLLTWLISAYGWRSALVITAFIIWGVCLPLALTVRNQPEEYGLLPDGVAPPPRPGPPGETPLAAAAAGGVSPAARGLPLAQALRSPAFWLMAIAVSLAQLSVNSILVHQFPYLTGLGFSEGVAALTVTGVAFISLTGRLGLGLLSDFVDKRKLLAVALLLQAAGVFVLAGAHSGWQIILFLFIFSPGFGGTVPLRAALQAEYFGRRSFGAILGSMETIRTLGTVVGPVLVGGMFDIMGTYRPAFLLVASLTLLAIPLVLAMNRPQPSSTPA